LRLRLQKLKSQAGGRLRRRDQQGSKFSLRGDFVKAHAELLIKKSGTARHTAIADEEKFLALEAQFFHETADECGEIGGGMLKNLLRSGIPIIRGVCDHGKNSGKDFVGEGDGAVLKFLPGCAIDFSKNARG